MSKHLSILATTEADVAIALHVARNVKIKEIRNFLHPFLLDLINAADVESGAVRFSVVVFGPDAKVEFSFDKFNKVAKLQKAVKRLKPKFIRTTTPDTARMFDVLTDSVYTVANGDRPEVPNILLIITDQKSTGNAEIIQEKAEALKSAGAEIFTIGVARANKNELQGIASDPVDDNIYLAPKYSALKMDGLKNKLGQRFPVCKFPICICFKHYIFNGS